MKLFNITLELLVETDIFWRAFYFLFRTYIEKGMKVRFLILVYGSPSTFHSWRENTEQLLTSVTLSVLAPLPGRKENICRVCLYALAGSVTLSFAFFSIFESFNTNRTGLSTGICLLQAFLTSTLVCQQAYLKVVCFLPARNCFSAAKSRCRVRGDVTRWCISWSRWRLSSHRPSEFGECRARISSQPNSGLWF